jgi:hypothetical protein
MAGRIPAVPGEGLMPQRSSPEWLVTIFFMAGRIPAVPGGKAYASAKPSGPSISLLDALARL